MNGPIALVGGGEFLRDAKEIDVWLLERVREKTVTVVPTAAANEHPERAVETASRYFEELGAGITAVMVLDNSDAKSPKLAKALRASSFIYLTGGDPKHLLRVLRGSAVWDAIREANSAGATLAGSSAGAMVLGDEMLVPGSDQTTEALGLIGELVLVPHFSQWGRRIAQIALAMSAAKRILALDEATGLVINSGRCFVLGAGSAYLFRGDEELWQKKAPAEVDDCLV